MSPCEDQRSGEVGKNECGVTYAPPPVFALAQAGVHNKKVRRDKDKPELESKTMQRGMFKGKKSASH